MNLYPMLMQPIYKDYIWGGDAFKNIYNKNTPYNITAESWEVSGHKDGMSIVANGEYAGLNLNELIAKLGKELLGKLVKDNKFPLLLKLIDASDRLSVQVHPDDKYAAEHENGELGKTEMWYILDAKPGAQLIYGFKDSITSAEFKTAILKNELGDILNFVPVQSGDVFFIKAGTVHAICEGLLIAEIQQNSNTTYRVYDWGRVGSDGKPRDLHINKAVDVSFLKSSVGTEKTKGLIIHQNGAKRQLLACCGYFGAESVIVQDSSKETANGGSFHILLILNGEGYIEYPQGQVGFKKGDSLVIPAGMGEYSVVGGCSYFKSYVPDYEGDFIRPLLNAGYNEQQIMELIYK